MSDEHKNPLAYPNRAELDDIRRLAKSAICNPALQTEHSPLPWRYYYSKSSGVYRIRDAGNHVVADLVFEADARLIVLAVNHFDEMREFIEMCAGDEEPDQLLAKLKEAENEPK